MLDSGFSLRHPSLVAVTRLLGLVVILAAAPALPSEDYSAGHVAAVTRMLASIPIDRLFRAGLREGRVEMQQRDPEKALFVESLMGDPSEEELSALFVPIFASRLSQAQADEITAFAHTSAGRKYFDDQFAEDMTRPRPTYSALERADIDRFRKSSAGIAWARAFDSPWNREVDAFVERYAGARLAALKSIGAELKAREARINAEHSKEALALQSPEMDIPQVLRSRESIMAGRGYVSRLEAFQARRNRVLKAFYTEWLSEMQRHVETGELPQAVIPWIGKKIRAAEATVDRQSEDLARRLAVYSELLDFAEKHQGKYAFDASDGTVAFEDDADVEAFNEIAARWDRLQPPGAH